MGTTELIASVDESVGGLDFLWLELTDKCNLACVHCYADSSPFLPLFEGMQLGDWKRVLHESYDAGCRKVQFIGGEPTVYPHLIELIRCSRDLGYELVEVFTNGTVFTERIREAFRQFRVHLAFSVYADNAPIHDSITLSAGSFSKTVKSIRWALANGIEVRAAIVEMSQNASAMDSTRNLLAEMGVSEIRIDRTRGVGRGSDDKSISGLDQLRGHCWNGKLCVTPNGDMFPCVFSRSWIVGTASEGVKAAIEGRRLLDFRSALRSTLQIDACSPARRKDDPGCNPVQNCLPVKGSTLHEHYHLENNRDREKCAPHVEKCIPVKHSESPANGSFH